MKTSVFFLTVFFWGFRAIAQSPSKIYKIDSVLNNEIDYKPLDEYKGLIYLKKGNVHLNTSNLSKKIRIYFYNSADTFKIRNLLNKNKGSFYLLVEIEVKKTKYLDSVMLEYSSYETSSKLFNYNPIWSKNKHKMKGLYIGGDKILLRYSKETKNWLPTHPLRRQVVRA